VYILSMRYRASLCVLRGLHIVASLAKRILRRIRRRFVSSGRKLESATDQHNRLILTGARKLGLRAEELPTKFLRISDGKKVIYSRESSFSFESLTAFWMCGDKHLTSLLLKEAGVPVPEFSVFHSSDLRSAFSSFHKLSPPLVVKPCRGSGGRGITVGIQTMRQFRRAVYRAALTTDRVVVERYVPGRHWRITLLDGELLFAQERLHAFVVGDGKSSIRALVNRYNNSIVLRDGFLVSHPVHIDGETYAALQGQDLTPSSVPKAGRNVSVKRICNAAAGGRTIDVTGSLHDDYLDLARRAASTMGARLAGVDLIAPDITVGKDGDCAVVNEVNTSPGLMDYDVSGSDNAPEYVGRLLSMIFF